MNSLPTVYRRSAVQDPAAASSTSSAPQATTVATAMSVARAAANDDDAAAPPADYLSNPLWMLAIGMAIFFGSMALLIASG